MRLTFGLVHATVFMSSIFAGYSSAQTIPSVLVNDGCGVFRYCEVYSSAQTILAVKVEKGILHLQTSATSVQLDPTPIGPTNGGAYSA